MGQTRRGMFNNFCSRTISNSLEPKVQINNTCNVARLIGTEAAKRGVKAYVRLQHPFYTTDKHPAQESDNIKPEGTYGTWWHETLRILGAIKE